MTSGTTLVGLPAPDRLGRLKAFSEHELDGEAFVDLAARLEREATLTGASRWTLRSLVPPGAAAPADLVAALGHDAEPPTGARPGLPRPGRPRAGGPLEVNRLPVVLEGGASAEYLWVSRNLGDRAPEASAQAAFLAKVERRAAAQEALFADYSATAAPLLDAADEAGWRVVCNDPIGAWGRDEVHGPTFRSLLQQLFWFERDVADAMLRGEGYSSRGHYVFAVVDRDGDALCVFVLARFPWGFEGTYTMVNPLLPLSRTARAARTLMLIANALVLDRHGAGTLLYGEANAGNIPACITAGYAVVPPRAAAPVGTIGPGEHGGHGGHGADPALPVHENIVWADNPIGTVRSIDADLRTPVPPSHREAEYVSYALMRARNAVILPWRDRAAGFLRRG